MEFSKFPGLLHVFVDSVDSKLRKFLNAENFSAAAIAQAPVRKNYDRKEFRHFLIFPEKITKMIVLLRLIFCGKSQMEPNDWSIF